MQEKLGKIFLSEDLKSIKIKIYISLVLSILTKLYFYFFNAHFFCWESLWAIFL